MHGTFYHGFDQKLAGEVPYLGLFSNKLMQMLMILLYFYNKLE